jgi:hypothetical protein
MALMRAAISRLSSLEANENSLRVLVPEYMREALVNAFVESAAEGRKELKRRVENKELSQEAATGVEWAYEDLINRRPKR